VIKQFDEEFCSTAFSTSVCLLLQFCVFFISASKEIVNA